MENFSGIDNMKATASVEIKNLLADVEELVARIADLQDADLDRMRDKVQRAVDAAKQSLLGRRRFGATAGAERCRQR